MAKFEQDREDLMREATALLPRAEIKLNDDPETITFGFRRSGGLSIFFGADPVFQFNSQRELRRAFVRGKLIKAVAGRLQSLDRRREGKEVVLWSTELTPGEEDELLAAAQALLFSFSLAIGRGDYQLLQQVPPQADAVDRVQEFLARLPNPLCVAQKANAG
jgi:hypothetical protein